MRSNLFVRKFFDKSLTYFITACGMVVIVMILSILFVLLTQVRELFTTSNIEPGDSVQLEPEHIAHIDSDPDDQVIALFTTENILAFYQRKPWRQLQQISIPQFKLSALSSTIKNTLFVTVDDSNTINIYTIHYNKTWPSGTALVVEPLFAKIPTTWQVDKTPAEIFIQGNDTHILVTLTYPNAVHFTRLDKEESLSGETTWNITIQKKLPFTGARFVHAAPNTQRIFLVHDQSAIAALSYANGKIKLLDELRLQNPVTSAVLAFGEESYVALDSNNEIHRTSILNKIDKGFVFQTFPFVQLPSGSYKYITPLHTTRGIFAMREDSFVFLHLSSGFLHESEKTALPKRQDLLKINFSDTIMYGVSAEALTYGFLTIAHPEVTVRSLLSKQLYEGYSEPAYVWQSGGGNEAVEAKYSFIPLIIGSFKAALYSLLVAIPFGICTAMYIGYFATSWLRNKIKPLFEMIQALPTVIMGMIGGLLLVPLMQEHFAAVISILFITPLLYSFISWVFFALAKKISWLVPPQHKTYILYQVPLFLVLMVGTWIVSDAVDTYFFAGHLREEAFTLSHLTWTPRNTFIVAMIMGFALIPTIFTIIEDAIFSAPKSLTEGSLALGASRWQTLRKVIMPAVYPAVFSAGMIALGRAVGETMIVLMATGNIPITSWNIFEGARTLSANISIEMPESAIGSTHYKLLFLSGLLLFIFTFCINTFAEFLRQRIRQRYKAM